MERLFRLFENWLDPLDTPPAADIPGTTTGFLWHFIRQARGVFILMLVLGGITAVLEAAIFSFVGVIVDMLDQGDPATLLADNYWILAGMVVTVLIIRPIIIVLTVLLEEQTVVPGFFNKVRWQTNQRVLNQSLSYFQDDFAGRIAAKIWQTGQAAGDFMISLLQIVWFIIVFALTTLFLLAELDVRFVLIVLLWLVVYAGLAVKIIPVIRARARITADTGSAVNGRLVDTYSNIQTVKLFGSREQELDGTRQSFEVFLRSLRRFTRMLTIMRSLLAVLGSGMIAGIGALSIFLWARAEVTSGEVAVVLGLTLRLNLLLNRMMGQLNGLFRNLGTVQDGMETIAKPILVRDRPGAGGLTVTKGLVVFDKVGFRYGPGDAVIDNLSLTIQPGEKVGLVGHSGAGKSTLIHLLLRFYDLDQGCIRIDGQDIAAVRQNSLRQAVGVVSQDTSLMHRSIRDNIAYGRAGSAFADVQEAARRAHADDFIVDLQDRKNRSGYDAHAGERGVKLSGGQRQRIAIARVLLKNAPILALDEATSSLDSEIEAAIQEQLNNLMTGKTVIAIAHRLSTIAAMDRLVVMEQGRIVETGTHRELIDREGAYARLWRRQSGGFLVPTQAV